MEHPIYKYLLTSVKSGRKLVALLLDPDTFSPENTPSLITHSGADLIFIGGSLISRGDFEQTIVAVKKCTSLPVIIFPGSILQISSKADAILNLSLISGRNPEFLIGQHVIAAPSLKASKLEILPAGYILVDSGRQTTASYISHTTPIPHDKDDIAMCTAMAGEMLGLRMIYLDGGSGAKETISESMIRKVKKNISVPLIVGGGIKDAATARRLCSAGADMIVIGNGVQENIALATDISTAVHSIPVGQ
jgi:phosphoglycerol geranylgeranyltransferase